MLILPRPTCITRPTASAPAAPRRTRASCRRWPSLCRDILIVGPGNERTTLLHYLQDNRKDLDATELHVEACDHPTDREIIALGRRRFGLD